MQARFEGAVESEHLSMEEVCARGLAIMFRRSGRC